MRKDSETYFFEIFNKQNFKCSMLIPDTAFVSGGLIASWYFTSKKENQILRKRQPNSVELFKTLYRQSSLSTQEDFDEKKLNEYLKKEESSDDENVSFNGQQAPEFQRKSSITKASAAQMMT